MHNPDFMLQLLVNLALHYPQAGRTPAQLQILAEDWAEDLAEFSPGVVEKAVKMAQMMNIPIVGLVENMSYLACPDCGRKIYLFGEGKTQEAADRYGLPLLAQMPIDPALAALVDAGRIEDFQGSWLSAAADRLEC